MIVFFCQVSQPNYDEDRKIIEKYLKHFYLKEKMPFEKFNKYYKNILKDFIQKCNFI